MKTLTDDDGNRYETVDDKCFHGDIHVKPLPQPKEEKDNSLRDSIKQTMELAKDQRIAELEHQLQTVQDFAYVLKDLAGDKDE